MRKSGQNSLWTETSFTEANGEGPGRPLCRLQSCTTRSHRVPLVQGDGRNGGGGLAIEHTVVLYPPAVQLHRLGPQAPPATQEHDISAPTRCTPAHMSTRKRVTGSCGEAGGVLGRVLGEDPIKGIGSPVSASQSCYSESLRKHFGLRSAGGFGASRWRSRAKKKNHSALRRTLFHLTQPLPLASLPYPLFKPTRHLTLLSASCCPVPSRPVPSCRPLAPPNRPAYCSLPPLLRLPADIYSSISSKDAQDCRS